MAHNAVDPPSPRPPAIALPPSQIINAPIGIYGIAYSLSVRDMQDSPPGGWARLLASIYREVLDHLSAWGFESDQSGRSVFQHECTATHAWNTLVTMQEIRRRNLSTVVLHLALFNIPPAHRIILMEGIQLREFFSPNFIATPAGLAEGMGEVPPAPETNGVCRSEFGGGSLNRE